MLENTQLIILAAGKGSRMNSDLPKVLLTVNDKPMIEHLFDGVVEGLSIRKPIVVVGYKSEEVKSYLGERAEYVKQKEQLGTGHAVKVTEGSVDSEIKYIAILYGDMPLVSAETIERLAKRHTESEGPVTMATVKVDDFEDWRRCLYGYGRIMRDDQNEITSIVEVRDATNEQKNITEVNPSFFFVDRDWLFKNLTALSSDNNQHEYYLTDIVGLAREQGLKIKSIQINPDEALGANTPDDLKILENIKV